jgi:hypothetical protein
METNNGQNYKLTSRSASSFSFWLSSYTYTGFTIVPEAGRVNNLVVLVI